MNECHEPPSLSPAEEAIRNRLKKCATCIWANSDWEVNEFADPDEVYCTCLLEISVDVASDDCEDSYEPYIPPVSADSEDE